MEAQTLSAEVRDTRGKGPARQLRKRGLIPAIYYGPGIEPKKLQLDPADLETALRGDYGRNQLLDIEVGSERLLAVVKDLEVHPVAQTILHADLYAVDRERSVETKVPLTTSGRAIGVQKGGSQRKLFRVLPVRARPQDVPAKIDIDVGPLDLGAIVTVADLALPEGVEVIYPPERRLLFIEAKKAVEDEEEPAEAEAASAAPS